MVNSPYRLYSQFNFPKLSQSVSECQEGLEIQSSNADFVHVDSPSGFIVFFIFQENIHATCAKMLSVQELDSMHFTHLLYFMKEQPVFIDYLLAGTP